jgi:hypothetical protein
VSLGPKTQSLVETLDALVSELRLRDQERWATWLERDRDLLRRGDFEGIRHFLSAFGGMGSLNDLNLDRADLLSRAYDLATEISRKAVVE